MGTAFGSTTTVPRPEGSGARLVLLLAAISFFAAAALHRGMFVEGHEHAPAATAEIVIGAVLLAALALSWLPSPWPRRAALAAQAFAVLGVVVGLVTIAVGVGPQSTLDVVYHLAMLVVLLVGLMLSRPAPGNERG